MVHRYTEINCPELGLSIEPGMILGAHMNEYRLISAIRSTNTFNHTYIRSKNIHILIALDTSGSMGTSMSGFSDVDPDMISSRLECCVGAINKLLEFLRVLAENGVEVYFTLVGFSGYIVPFFEHQRILPDTEKIKQMQDRCNLIHPSGATNVGVLLNYVSDIRRKYEMDESESNTGESTTYSILLSDGYITMGPRMSDIDSQRSQNPQWIFNTSIGIGETSDYDSELLNLLTSEDECRGCACSNDLYDNLISSIFQQMDVHAKDIKWNGEFAYEYPLRGSTLRYGQFIAAASSTIFARYEPMIELDMQIRNINIEGEIPEEYSKSIQSGIWTVAYTINKSDDIYHVKIRIIADTLPRNARSIRYQHRHTRIMEDYLKLVREFNTYDLESRVMVNELYLHFSKWLSDIEGVDTSHVIERMKAIISEMWKRIEQLYQHVNESEEMAWTENIPSLPQIHTAQHVAQHSSIFPMMRRLTTMSGYQYDPVYTAVSQPAYQTPSMLTPSQTISSIRIMRSQTANGNHAFIGRMMTESYSQSSI